ncbi:MULTISPECIES: glycosyltransferase family 1 protein [Moorena]|uniref:Glycosyltransferase n=1 Tax=Moorena producens 3L TaxID=489825 RepID=F4XN52_9CYAN|nr:MULTISPECIES: glycosyltransferase family 1 protein [Moorena]EGJ34111.1 hypothetical protein LYNGBM3L_21170 [Moorena producens 3L]NEP35288.1 glycosyltransferase family 1 protein [Moorena sp. SIO3B2]NEP65576.1 glycosyltransferase family 1 protein [Moorena sp. SIO3A5]NER85553.1 glycosyltransferase family 1 protein [Moorena sp. SIO3A2]NES42978.1 glycosyltransferase family 1 protein [Moorena sp. SIO2C4]
MIIIFSGSIGRFPVGGHAWINIQYLLGLRALGHDVFYLEDCGQQSWVYDWENEESTNDLEYPTTYIRDCLEPFDFQGKWIYRAGNQSQGMALDDFLDICSQAELLIVRAVPLSLWRDEYNWPKRRIFIDADPGFTQMRLVSGDVKLSNMVSHCEQLFSIAQRLEATDCSIPTADHKWIKTLSPIFLPEWPLFEHSSNDYFTTIFQWKSYGKSHSYNKVIYQGVHYGQKDKEFTEFLDLPQYTSQLFRIALTGGTPKQMSKNGWEVVPGWLATQTPWSYRKFIQESRAEFSVAKQGYVLSRGGWFSDRSACYLASGRPILVQDTGISDYLPTGKGILTFRNLSEALEGIESINADYEQHCLAARQIAAQYFSTDRVLPPLLEVAMS